MPRRAMGENFMVKVLSCVWVSELDWVSLVWKVEKGVTEEAR